MVGSGPSELGRGGERGTSSRFMRTSPGTSSLSMQSRHTRQHPFETTLDKRTDLLYPPLLHRVVYGEQTVFLDSSSYRPGHWIPFDFPAIWQTYPQMALTSTQKFYYLSQYLPPSLLPHSARPSELSS